MTKVLVFGTFDGLHEGHKALFRQAKEFGDYLIVAVSRDSTAKKNKNKMPKFNEQKRLKMVQDYELVDEALLGREEHNPSKDRYELILKIRPDVVCLGYDQAQFRDKLEKELKEMNLYDTEVRILEPYKPKEYHSSIINK
ncbi:MAG: adenylyltransferase/cytidyltransferase family protein [Candidatus Staskawiczbacteria bacterium]|nr:adenylyltransferase/cytidyltransferase family protein [Candidatus Staskawiczbacteria bacterium]MBI3337475.1 adenylyltransferase/cytidyltransferase family protein [Candidatus Staskawiczbacteria bacterium]